VTPSSSNEIVSDDQLRHPHCILGGAGYEILTFSPIFILLFCIFEKKNNMKQVSISLNPEIASAYENATVEERKKVDYIVNSWLKSIFIKKADAREELLEIMQTAGKIAQANGLTPEKLLEILNEKE
jgi:hypothetical protein